MMPRVCYIYMSHVFLVSQSSKIRYYSRRREGVQLKNISVNIDPAVL